jgi:plastocyanin
MPSRTTTRPLLALGVLVSAIALAACGSSGSGASTAPSVAASEAAPSAAAPSEAASAEASAEAGGANAVTIQNFAFGPATVSVPVGTTITWTNADSASHTVTADDGSFDSGSLGSGATFSQAFDTAGTFAYHCKIHPNMTASVEVK